MTTSSDRFRALHDEFFLLPNPWDVGSAGMLRDLGFLALATTSSGLAMAMDRTDGEVEFEELVDHTAAVTARVDLPLNIDAERCFADDLEGVTAAVTALAHAGAAGVSIEDWNPASQAIDPIETATARVAAAAEAAAATGIVLTGRCENHIRGVTDLDDTLTRLAAYRDAGAEVLYAPGANDADGIRAIVALGAPVNVLGSPAGLPPAELAALGVRRMSTGGALARTAYSAARDAAAALISALEDGKENS